MTTKRFFYMVIIVLLVIFGIAIINWIGEQQDNIGSLRDEIANLRNNLDNRINSEMSSLKEEIMRELTVQNSNVYNAGYVTTGYNGGRNLAHVTVHFSLKEYANNSKVTLFYTGNNQTNSVETRENKGVFEADLELSLKDDSAGYVIGYKINGDTVESGYLFDIFPSYDLHARISAGGYSVEHRSTGTSVRLSTKLQNTFGRDDKLKFVSCVMNIYAKNQIIERIDLMNELENSGDYQFSSIDREIDYVSLGVSDPQEIYIKITAVDGYGFEYIY